MILCQLSLKILKVKIARHRDPGTFEIWLTWFSHTPPALIGWMTLGKFDMSDPDWEGRHELRNGCTLAGHGNQSVIFRVLQLLGQVAFFTNMLHRDWPTPLHKCMVQLCLVTFASLIGKTNQALVSATSGFSIWFWLPPVERLADLTAGEWSLQ